MPTAKKPTNTSKQFSAKQVAAAKAAAEAVPDQPDTDWSSATITRGGGVQKTIAEIQRHRGPNKRPTKEQVAIRLDPEVLGAFRAGGPGWQTRMNNALKEWLADHPSKPRAKRAT
jgi:uncharacterized protein (DUF4415 family)